MRRVTTAALAAIVLLLGLIGAGASAATAPPRASVGGVSSAASPTEASAKCEFKGISECSSANPSISLFFSSSSDTSACRFELKIDWNDGGPVETVTVSGGAQGSQIQVGAHTYTFARNNPTYTIPVTGKTVTGSCSVSGATFTFHHLSCDSSHVSGPSWAS